MDPNPMSPVRDRIPIRGQGGGNRPVPGGTSTAPVSVSGQAHTDRENHSEAHAPAQPRVVKAALSFLKGKGPTGTKSKFGTFTGVLGRCLVKIWGPSRAGGVYYMISRSLGPQYGGAIGLLFFIANSCASALHMLGVAETVEGFLSAPLFGSVGTDMTVFGLILLGVGCIVCSRGVAWVVKMDMALLVTLVTAITSVIAGSFFLTHGDGWIPYGIATKINLGLNLASEYSVGVSFLTLFALFFPALTGINAGANITNDLSSPSKSIPQGTLGAVVTSSSVYLILIWILAAVVERRNLKADLQIMNHLSVWGPLVSFGTIAAGISSSLSCLFSAPRVLTALAKDDIIKHPVMQWFAVETDRQPLRALVLTGIICVVCLFIGSLNFISPIITSFFLLSYLAVNWACYSAEVAKAPSWRPTFKYFHKNAALAGAALSLAIMLILSPSMTAVALLMAAGLFKAIESSASDISWGSTSDALVFRLAAQFAMQAEKVADSHAHVKTFRPQLLTLVGDPLKRASLAELAAGLVSDRGLTLLASVVPEQPTWEESVGALKAAKASSKKWLQDRHGQLSGFEMSVLAKSVRAGAQHLMLSGIGPFHSNTVVVGMKTLLEEGVTAIESHHPSVKHPVAPPLMAPGVSADEWVGILRDACALGQGVVTVGGTEHLYAQAASVSRSKSGRLDVYWLADDGGLTLLLAYLMSMSPDWRGCQLRVFCSALGRELTEQRQRMETFLHGLRIKAEVQGEGDLSPGEESHLNSFLSSHRDAALTIDMGTAERLEGTSDHGSVFGLWKLDGGASQADEAAPTTGREVVGRDRGREGGRDGHATPPSGLAMLWGGRERETLRGTTPSATVSAAASPTPVQQSGYYLRSVPVPKDMVQQTRRFYRLGNVISHLSSGSNAVFVTMPLPQLDIEPALYVAWCNAICDIRGVPIVLIRGVETVLEVE
ncbi:hypothetical protein KIPB_005618 [Kipferlia bialata]|uniref:Amino acid permease/ SLC12A domain-containing protein n=1 Tax=Kipferlia bialata TaxID=797122 RepID=A0A9K3CXK5_9EUKA|nr:hypothetical protein KIPB_005618 [Kipferlia bialata]|eukprot:g5618.t1